MTLPPPLHLISYQTWKHLPDSKRPKVGRWSLLPFGLGPKIRWGEADRKRGFVAQGLWKLSRQCVVVRIFSRRSQNMLHC